MRVTPDPPILMSSAVGMAICLLFLFIGWSELRNKRRRRHFRNAGPIGILALGVAGLIFLTVTGASRLNTINHLTKDIRTGKFKIYDGCIHNLRLISFGGGRGGSREGATFYINGTLFEIDGQNTNIGYKTVHHYDFPSGEPISENAHLRVFASRGHMLRIEAFEKPCPNLPGSNLAG